MESRSRYWVAAWRAFLDQPVVGTGLDTLHLRYPRYQVATDHNFTGTTLTDKPHNIYLERAADTGLLGGGSFLALIGLGLWYGYRESRRLEGPSRLLMAAFLGSFVAYLTQGLVSIDDPPLAVMGWVSLGGIATLADPRTIAARDRLKAMLSEGRQHRRRKQGKRRQQYRVPAPPPDWHVVREGPLRWPVHLVVSVVAVGLLVVGVRPLRAELEVESGHLDEAIKLQPFEAIYRATAGEKAQIDAIQAKTTSTKRAHLTQALARYEQALHLWPGSVALMISIADVHTAWAKAIDPARFAEADRWWLKVVATAPKDAQAHRRYAVMLSEWSRSSRDPSIGRRAAEQYRRADDLQRTP